VRSRASKAQFLVAEQLNPTRPMCSSTERSRLPISAMRAGGSIWRKGFRTQSLHPDWYYYFASQFKCSPVSMIRPMKSDTRLCKTSELGGWMAAVSPSPADTSKPGNSEKNLWKRCEGLVGSQPMIEQDAVEWFFLVNRWLHDRDRDRLARV